LKNKDKIRNTIINLLLDETETTRTELVDYLEIRPATLFEIVNSLKEEGILFEPERKGKKTGRKASKICLNPEFGYYLGIDFEMEHTIGVLLNACGEIVFKKEISSNRGKDIDAGMKEIKEVCNAVIDFLGSKIKLLKGVGFADAGVVDVDNKKAVKAINIKGWENIDLGKIFQDLLDCSCTAYPGPSSRAFMEYHNREGEEKGSLFHMELSCGVGGGFIKEDKVFLGDSYSSMEVGHIVIKENGTLCQCGNKGCLETIAGADGIKRSVDEIIKSGVSTLLCEQPFSIPYFVECVKRNDKAASALAMEICENIGIALASVVSIINPSIIVFSGPLSGLGEFLTTSVMRILSLRCFPSAVDKVRLVTSNLPKESTAAGAGLLMRQKDLLG
jgi:predicted NBD/HSP70 family sugar kinase